MHAAEGHAYGLPTAPKRRPNSAGALCSPVVVGGDVELRTANKLSVLVAMRARPVDDGSSREGSSLRLPQGLRLKDHERSDSLPSKRQCSEGSRRRNIFSLKDDKFGAPQGGKEKSSPSRIRVSRGYGSKDRDGRCCVCRLRPLIFQECPSCSSRYCADGCLLSWYEKTKSRRAAPVQVPVVSASLGAENVVVSMLDAQHPQEEVDVNLVITRIQGSCLVARTLGNRGWSITAVDGWEFGAAMPGFQWRPSPGVLLTLEELGRCHVCSKQFAMTEYYCNSAGVKPVTRRLDIVQRFPSGLSELQPYSDTNNEKKVCHDVHHAEVQTPWKSKGWHAHPEDFADEHNESTGVQISPIGVGVVESQTTPKEKAAPRAAEHLLQREQMPADATSVAEQTCYTGKSAPAQMATTAASSPLEATPGQNWFQSAVAMPAQSAAMQSTPSTTGSKHASQKKNSAQRAAPSTPIGTGFIEPRTSTKEKSAKTAPSPSSSSTSESDTGEYLEVQTSPKQTPQELMITPAKNDAASAHPAAGFPDAKNQPAPASPALLEPPLFGSMKRQTSKNSASKSPAIPNEIRPGSAMDVQSAMANLFPKTTYPKKK